MPDSCENFSGQQLAYLEANYVQLSAVEDIVNTAVNNALGQQQFITAEQAQDLINESIPGWGLDGTWLVFVYASWWWLLECPSESPGIEIANGVPFWRNVIMGPQGPQVALGCQRVIKRRLSIVGGKPGWESHELNRQEDGTWI